jgi:H+/Cl- antiporter ClcA
VVEAFRGGFQLGYVPPLPSGQTYPYPWVGVILAIIATAIPSIFLFLVLRPHRFTWSLPRVGIAFTVFFLLSFLVLYTSVTDQPGYAYVPGDFVFLLTFLLFILLIITVTIVLVKHLRTSAHAR